MPLPLSSEVSSQSNARHDVPRRYVINAPGDPGAMGIVYKAWDKKLKRDVAIKFILNGSPSRRFSREAQLLAQIESRHVVHVYDFSRRRGKTPMIVMEWVEGESLQKILDRNRAPLTEHQVVQWMKNVCEGLDAANAKRIVHRDLKPSNILINKDGKAKVVDFGLAGIVRADRVRSSADAPYRLGNTLTMAPEQAKDARKADVRSDIYSFGATFYYALTGRPPFQAHTVNEVIKKHQNEAVVSPKAICPELTEGISQLLERCLAKSPDARFQTFAELAHQLEELEDRILEPALLPLFRRFLASLPNYLAGRIPSGGERYDFDGGTIQFVCGDITKQDAQALVSPDNYLLTMDYGPARAIRKAAGESVFQEARRYVPAQDGRVFVTSAGNLGAFGVLFILHAVTNAWNGEQTMIPSLDSIWELMKSCVSEAHTLRVKTLAFPILSLDVLDVPDGLSLEMMFRYLARTFSQGISSVKLAKIVFYPT